MTPEFRKLMSAGIAPYPSLVFPRWVTVHRVRTDCASIGVPAGVVIESPQRAFHAAGHDLGGPSASLGRAIRRWPIVAALGVLKRGAADCGGVGAAAMPGDADGRCEGRPLGTRGVLDDSACRGSCAPRGRGCSGGWGCIPCQRREVVFRARWTEVRGLAADLASFDGGYMLDMERV